MDNVEKIAGGVLSLIGKPLYRRLTTRLELQVRSANPVASFYDENVVSLDANQAFPEDTQEASYAKGGWKRASAVVLLKNVRGGDLRSGFTVTIGMPVAQTMWSPSTGDAFFSLRDLPTLKIEPGVIEAGYWFLRLYIERIVPVTHTVRVAQFSFMVPADNNQPIHLKWQVVADSLPHPRKGYGSEPIRIVSLPEYLSNVHET